MENIYVEELTNSSNYAFILHYEFPLNQLFSYNPEIKAEVRNVRPVVTPEGLMINGTIFAELKIIEKKNFQFKNLSFHFNYLIADLKICEQNLLDYEFDLIIEQLNYHLIKKKGQVFLNQEYVMKLNLFEYSVQEKQISAEGCVEIRTGILKKKFKAIERHLLKIYPIDLPEDFLRITNLMSQCDDYRLDRFENGYIVSFQGFFQLEYVTLEHKLKRFFFERQEHIYLTVPDIQSVLISDTTLKLKVQELSMENETELLVLYHCELDIFQQQKTNYYTPIKDLFNQELEIKKVEVEEITPPLEFSQLVNEKIDLSQLNLTEIHHISAVITNIEIEALQAELLITGELEYTLSYFDQDAINRTWQNGKRVEQMVVKKSPEKADTNKWTVNTDVEIPCFKLNDSNLSFDIMINYKIFGHYTTIQPVLIDLPGNFQQTKREKYLLTELIDSNKVILEKEGLIYLQRYAENIMQLDSEVSVQQTRFVKDGWLIKGSGEHIIYFLTHEGEHHYSKWFSFYHYIFFPRAKPDMYLNLNPTIEIIDHELMEDGSLVRIGYLLIFEYCVYRKTELQLITEIDIINRERERRIIKMGKIEEKVELVLSIQRNRFLFEQMKKLWEVKLSLEDYEINFQNGDLNFQAELLIRIVYYNRWGKLTRKDYREMVHFTRAIDIKNEQYSKIKVIPLIKNYEYLLLDHFLKNKHLNNAQSSTKMYNYHENSDSSNYENNHHENNDSSKYENNYLLSDHHSKNKQIYLNVNFELSYRILGTSQSF